MTRAWEQGRAVITCEAQLKILENNSVPATKESTLSTTAARYQLVSRTIKSSVRWLRWKNIWKTSQACSKTSKDLQRSIRIRLTHLTSMLRVFIQTRHRLMLRTSSSSNRAAHRSRAQGVVILARSFPNIIKLLFSQLNIVLNDLRSEMKKIGTPKSIKRDLPKSLTYSLDPPRL